MKKRVRYVYSSCFEFIIQNFLGIEIPAIIIVIGVVFNNKYLMFTVVFIISIICVLGRYSKIKCFYYVHIPI